MNIEYEHEELDKLVKIALESNIIGAFLEWLMQDQGVMFMVYRDRSDTPRLWGKTIEKMLAEYYGIDMNKVSKERQGLLDTLRKQQDKTNATDSA